MKKQLLFLSLLVPTHLILSSSNDDEINQLSKKLTQSCIVSDINEQSGKSNHTKLIKAAINGDNDQVLGLMLQKADPYIAGKKGDTALIQAAYRGHTPVVLTLLALSDNKEKLLDAKLVSGHSVIDCAKTKKHSHIVEILSHVQNQTVFGPTCITHFSPKILPAIKNCIKNEQKGIKGAMYSFTHGDPAKACVRLCNKGGTVEFIIDKDYAYNTRTKSFNKNKKANICVALRYMIKHGIDLYECNLGSNKDTNNGYFNMHNKFLLFKKNAKDKPLLITGSCNFTHQAFTKNWENIIIIDDINAIKAFTKQYITMKKSAIKLTKGRCKSDKDKDYWALRNNKLQDIV